MRTYLHDKRFRFHIPGSPQGHQARQGHFINCFYPHGWNEKLNFVICDKTELEKKTNYPAFSIYAGKTLHTLVKLLGSFNTVPSKHNRILKLVRILVFQQEYKEFWELGNVSLQNFDCIRGEKPLIINPLWPTGYFFLCFFKLETNVDFLFYAWLYFFFLSWFLHFFRRT